MEQAEIMVSTELLKQFRSLPQKVQKGITTFIESFRKNPHDPALYIHDLDAEMADKKVRGAKLPDGYRAILIKPEKGNTWVFMYADSHDKAYAWAKNKRFERHQMTGVFQVFDPMIVEQKLEEPEFQAKPPEPSYPLAKLDEDTLFYAGVPKPLIPSIKAISSDDQFEALAEYLPEDCREMLTALAAGMALDEALELTLGVTKQEPKDLPESPGDFTDLQAAPSFGITLLEAGDDALRRALEGTLDEWRLFLHPSQKKIVEWKTNGPVKVTGTAGTGKTVALMHRAVRLASELESPEEKVLVTTFTINLAHNIRKQLGDLDPKAAKRIDVAPVFSLARSECHREGWRGTERFPEELDDVWTEVFRDKKLVAELPISREELQLEFEEVIDPFGVESLEEYLTVVRTGRPRLVRDQRRKVWDVMAKFLQLLKERDIITPNGLLRQARLVVEKGGKTAYRHVLVDEAQDLSLEALRFVNALAPSGKTDPLFLAGDGHQRIYKSRVPLSRAGINVVGRSRRLKINYRTTQEIRKWAYGVLTGAEIDDLDGGSADTRGDRSLLSGPPPKIVRCKSKAEEADIVVDWVKGVLETGVKPYEICITPWTPEILTRLQKEAIPSRELKATEADLGSADPGVRYGSRERIKGLEFKAVALARFEMDGGDALRERTMDYVAATRARGLLLVTRS